MNRKVWTHGSLAGALLLSIPVARSQEGPPPPPSMLMLQGGPEEKMARKMPFRGHGERSAEKAEKFEQRMQLRLQKEQASGEIQKQSLGTQFINGVNAEGTRVTRTIPAGQIGNDKPIQVVSERWYSADLQMVVKSTHTDPRFGTTTYTLTNVQRTEPAASLFTVPS